MYCSFRGREFSSQDPCQAAHSQLELHLQGNSRSLTLTHRTISIVKERNKSRKKNKDPQAAGLGHWFWKRLWSFPVSNTQEKEVCLPSRLGIPRAALTQARGLCLSIPNSLLQWRAEREQRRDSPFSSTGFPFTNGYANCSPGFLSFLLILALQRQRKAGPWDFKARLVSLVSSDTRQKRATFVGYVHRSWVWFSVQYYHHDHKKNNNNNCD